MNQMQRMAIAQASSKTSVHHNRYVPADLEGVRERYATQPKTVVFKKCQWIFGEPVAHAPRCDEPTVDAYGCSSYCGKHAAMSRWTGTKYGKPETEPGYTGPERQGVFSSHIGMRL